MFRYFKILLVLVAVILLLPGCSNLNNEPSPAKKDKPPKLTSSEILDNMNRAIHPDGKIPKVNTFLCTLRYILLKKASRKRFVYEYEIYRDNTHDILLFEEKKTVQQSNSNFITTFELLIRNGERKAKLTENGVAEESFNVTEDLINKYEDMARTFGQNYLLTGFTDALSTKVGKKRILIEKI